MTNYKAIDTEIKTNYKPIDAKIKITVTEPLLGTQTKSKELMEGYLKEKKEMLFKKHKIEKNTSDEIISETELDSSLEEKEKKAWTGFMQEDGKSYVLDYWVQGFFKNAIQTLAKELNFKQGRSKFDKFLFVFPRKIFIKGQLSPTPLERPLRVMTMQGPRVSLAKSDYFKVGASLVFTLKAPFACDITKELLFKLLDYGQYSGLGQFRNGGYGRFTWEELK